MGTSALRRSLATLFALVATSAMYVLGPYDVAHGTGLHFGDHEWLALCMPVLLLALSGGLVHGRSFGSQLLARAVWWSNLVLGGLILTFSNSSDRHVALFLLGGSAAALLAAGKQRLDAASASFAPVAFRGTLTAILVMALADVQSLVLFGVLSMGKSCCGRHLYGYAFLAVAALLGVALLGLFRLRVWGLALTVLANLGLIAVMLVVDGALPAGIRGAYIVSAVVQLAVMVPLVRALVRGRSTAA